MVSQEEQMQYDEEEFRDLQADACRAADSRAAGYEKNQRAGFLWVIGVIIVAVIIAIAYQS